jgi:carbamoyl-phosphate synthase large subunit
VKSPVFPWNKFPGVDTVLGPEMKSTGEVMGSADTFGEAFAKAQLSAGQALPTRGTVFISVIDRYKQESIELARRFVELGFRVVATHGTADRLEKAGLAVDRVYKVKEGRPNVVDLIKGDSVQLIVNTPHGAEPWFDDKAIRRAAVTNRIPTITTIHQHSAKIAFNAQQIVIPKAGNTLMQRALNNLLVAIFTRQD